MEEVQDMNLIFSQLNLSPGISTSRSAAKKAKELAMDYDTCICCYRAFDTRSQILKHFKKVHKADKDAIKKQYWEDKADLANNPESPVALHNYNHSAVKLAFLIRYKLNR